MYANGSIFDINKVPCTEKAKRKKKNRGAYLEHAGDAVLL
jgi:hypothetical protein